MKGRKECGSHTRVGEEKGRSVEMAWLSGLVEKGYMTTPGMAWIRADEE